MTTCPLPSNEKDILIVEDSKFQRNTLARALSQWNYNVYEAKDGVEGFDLFKRHSPKVIITDLQMPKMDGFKLVSAIRKHQIQYTYIIVISGMEDKESIVHAISSGADDYMTKPFHPGELEVRLNAAERVLRLESQNLLIFALAQLADYRSKETGFHLERVQHYSRILAEDLLEHGLCDLNQAKISLIYSMSCLHDIGKVAIPDFILNKPGKLSNLEFSIMKKHTTIGGSLLVDIAQKTNSDQLSVASDIVMYHHERYDGTGYPEGLSGDDIPVVARIVALADVFDALSSSRCYKPAYDSNKCEEIILSEKGKHFDPVIVESFERKKEEFWNIYDRFSEE